MAPHWRPLRLADTQLCSGLVKIGRSEDVRARLSSGNTFCAPAPHVVVAATPTFDAVRDEAMAHGYFANVRKQGEFFEVSVEAVQQYVLAHTTTRIDVELSIDGTGKVDISTGVGFFDHMLEQLARHSLMDLTVKAEGDLHIDFHHTVEDTGIAIGQALRQAMGDLRGITRYADVHLPMDETMTSVALDVSGRAFLVFRTSFHTPRIGEFDTQLVREFFQAFAMNAGITLHIETLYGENDHHISESCFKGVARALGTALRIDPRQQDRVPSTKGTLSG